MTMPAAITMISATAHSQPVSRRLLLNRTGNNTIVTPQTYIPAYKKKDDNHNFTIYRYISGQCSAENDPQNTLDYRKMAFLVPTKTSANEF